MKKTKLLRCGVILVACLMLVIFASALIPEGQVSAEEVKTYSTTTSIEKQGDNGFYYVWGTPNNYMLMFYGAVAGGGKNWRGLEIYQTANGSAIHPGNCWGSMVVWVANESGKVKLDGWMEKGTTNGDGVNLGVYHQHFGGELDTLFEKFVKPTDELKYPLETEIEVKKGDSFVFYCDSGMGKDNPSDSCGCPFTITYTRTDGDAVENEDLSQYLSVGRAGDIGGFKHIEANYAADNLDGIVVKTTTTKDNLPTLLWIVIPSVVVVVVAAVVAVLVIRRKK